MAFALTEPGAGTDSGGTTTTALRDGDYYVLNGRKTFITTAPVADWCIVYAKTDLSEKNRGRSRGISAFIVDMKLPGVSCGKAELKMGIIGCPTSDIILEDVRVHKDDLLGEENRGFQNAMKTLDIGRIGVAATSIGVAQGALDEAVKYAKERKQFGRAIAEFQAISFMIADMATKLQAAKELTYRAAQLKDINSPEAGPAASMAKYYASEVCNEIAAKAVQIHGGYGFIKEYKVERIYRDCRVFTIFEGTSQVQQMVISGSLLGK
jgi:alkylation response protein AidB-like acyl-CoA dehydrogenase